MKVAVIGGSLGGLTAALLLHDMGADVHVYERSANELVQRGAGIGFLPESQRYLVSRAGVALDDISIATHHIRYLDRAGAIVHDEQHNYRFSSWNTVYRQLYACVKPDMYRLGHEMVDWHDDGDSVRVDFRNGTHVTVDLVVFADGVNSLARQRLIPTATPNYAGYVAWRGMVHRAVWDVSCFLLQQYNVPRSAAASWGSQHEPGTALPGDRRRRRARLITSNRGGG